MSDPETAEPQNAATKALAIFREYHVVVAEGSGPKGLDEVHTALKPVTAGIHNTNDHPVPIEELMFGLILGAGVKDGDSFEILVRRTAQASPAIKLIKWIIDKAKGLVPVKLTPKKLIVPGPPTNLN